ncbi:phospholipase A2 isozymes PA3A/PA3B/PA5-like [Diadema antillarum]|uniref:phospholipase A2 isozymes PA3A/PA3B/PA5-like n=1 Tax=Diadema antillarum TaxID=105358 RepID=UPI003A86DE25
MASNDNSGGNFEIDTLLKIISNSTQRGLDGVFFADVDNINKLPPSLQSLVDIKLLLEDCKRLLKSTGGHNSITSSQWTDSNAIGHHRRARRSLMFPGTQWCGPGSTAKYRFSLGKHVQTDMCCRAHDYCPPEMQIVGFETKYHYTNKQLFTLSHCACDKRFHKCLRQVRNSVSYHVGNAFFNVFGTQCFVVRKRRQCVEKGWWAWEGCKRYEKLPTAVLRDPRPFPKLTPRNRTRSGNHRRRNKVKQLD